MLAPSFSLFSSPEIDEKEKKKFLYFILLALLCSFHSCDDDEDDDDEEDFRCWALKKLLSLSMFHIMRTWSKRKDFNEMMVPKQHQQQTKLVIIPIIIV
jgi:hypothetical protein